MIKAYIKYMMNGANNMKKSLIIFLCIIAIIYIIFFNSNQVEGLKNVPSIYSQNAILVENKTGKVLLTKNTDQMVYPASLTKIMTVLLAIEYSEDLNKKFYIDQKMLDELMIQNASVAGFQAGDEVTIEDLLYGAMLSSGADATTTLAKAISGSEEEFAKLMNKKAKELGMDKTNFVNASGLHHPNHYTTINDLSKLLSYALKNEEFKKIFTTPSHITKPLKSKQSGLVLSSTLFTKLWNPTLENGVTIIGGKTGYTEQAGYCLASLAKKDGKEYFLITVNAKGESKYSYHIEDAVLVYSKL